MKKILKIVKDFFEDFFKNISPKVVTKVIKKQVGVVCVIPFAPPLDIS
jgi:hypothetical protein